MTTHNGTHQNTFTEIEDAGPHGQYALDSHILTGTGYTTPVITISFEIQTGNTDNAPALEQKLIAALLSVVKS